MSSAPYSGKLLVVQAPSNCVHVLQGTQTLGQYMVGDVLTTKETILSWTGIAILFFVVLVPTTNQTILAYFTSEVSSIARWLAKS